MQRAFDLVTRFPSPLLIIRQPIVSSWESLMDPIHCRSGLYTLLTDLLTACTISMREEMSARFWQTIAEILSSSLCFFPPSSFRRFALYVSFFVVFIWILPFFHVSFAVVLYWLSIFWHLFSRSDSITAYRMSLGSFPANYSHFSATHSIPSLAVTPWYESHRFRQGHCDTISYMFLAYGKFSL